MEIDHEAILQTFLAETEENLAGVEEALVELEARPEDEEALGTIFRAAHTLKGDATSFGFQGVAELAHAMENVLDRLRSGAMPVSSEVVTRLLACVDVLRRMVPAAAKGGPWDEPAAWEVMTALDALLVNTKRPAGGGTYGWAHGDAGPVHSPSLQKSTLRVDTGKLDKMLNLITEITIARGRLGQMIEAAGATDPMRLLEAHRTADSLYRDLQELIMRARMVPIEGTFRSYIRIVRDLASESGKIARLVIDAQGVEVDTRIAEHIRDPLTHMIRNAIDHGLETPEERVARGKEECGVVTLLARHESGSIVVEVGDDGAGIDRAKIAERAAATGLAPNAHTMSDQELFQLILEPGFSTADAVSRMSGRGIGMDVVRRNVEAVRGSLRIESAERVGTVITIRLPLTLAVIDGFGVGVGGETYVIPIDAVVECVELPAEERSKDGGRGVINLRGQALPYIHLRALLAIEADAPARQSVVVVHYDGGRAGLVVDSLFGEGQTVIKPLGRMFNGVTGISGSAILNDGRVALILDVPTLLRKALAAA
jgi:two-component system chemotaxis sensor kinase CheA